MPRPRWARATLRVLGVAAVALTGSALGAALAPAVPAQVGPLTAEVRVRPGLGGGVRVLLPPIGEVSFATNHTPVVAEVRIAQVDRDGARALIDSPKAVRGLQSTAPEELRRAAVLASAVTGGCALTGAIALSVLVHRRRWRRTAEVAGSVAGLLAVLAGATALDLDADRLAQPHFSGLLADAPYVASATGGMMERLEGYRSGVADLVRGVTVLYGVGNALPSPAETGDVVRVLHVSDLHLNPLGYDLVSTLVKQFRVDLVVDSGDLSTWGTDTEASTLSWVGRLGVPYVAVRGNHDSPRTEAALAAQRRARVLGPASLGGEASVTEVAGLVVAGIGDPVFTPDVAAAGTPATPSVDAELAAGRRLASAITAWNATHPDRPVQVAVVHEPYAVPPVSGLVPLVLTGHFHSRDVSVDAAGTRVMRQGSTGGAGISADFTRVSEGQPLPLEATVVYVARSGDRAGQVVAYDEVTVGGFGLTSAAVARTVVRP